MTGTYVTPADVTISSSWQDHKDRKPPSKEPGTDFNTPYGTDIRMAESGVIVIVDNDNSGAEGRRLELIMDNGEVIDYLHLSKISGVWNQRVTRGQTGIALSGASGNGSDHYYGPHVHVTRRTTPGLPYASSVDFMAAVGAPASGGDTPFNPSNLTPEEIMNPILLQLDTNVDGRFVLIDFTKGTYWPVNNGWQLDRIKEDKNVKQISGPQPVTVVNGLTAVGAK